MKRTMTGQKSPAAAAICDCAPAALDPRVYYVWSRGDEKLRVEGVTQIHVTEDGLVLERGGEETLVVPLRDVFMVTCQVCSPPPLN